MTTTTAQDTRVTSTSAAVLHVAVELGERRWTIGSTPGFGQPPRQRSVRGGDGEAVVREVAQAKRRFGLPAATRVVCCYEAGPEGFWLARLLRARGLECLVIDSSSIEVNRRKRRAKTDTLDLRALLRLLIRHCGDPGGRSLIRGIPSPTPACPGYPLSAYPLSASA